MNKVEIVARGATRKEQADNQKLQDIFKRVESKQNTLAAVTHRRE